MIDFHKKLEGIRNQLSKKLSHPYLLRNIAVPVIDEDKLLLLVSLLDQLGLEKDEIDNYSITTMLLQIALDTHEHVQNSQPGEESPGMKDRQLTVLAGTYYSGLFYKQLAEIRNIEMITTLATGVKEVNEHKISVYRRDSDSIDKLMNSVKLIESSLVNRLALSFGAHSWKEFASNLLFIKRMTDEENQFLRTGTSIVFEGLKTLAFPKTHQDLTNISIEQKKYLLSICERYINFSASMIEAATKKLPTMENLMKVRRDEIIGQHQSISTLEEG